jgi:hypothetical protein
MTRELHAVRPFDAGVRAGFYHTRLRYPESFAALYGERGPTRSYGNLGRRREGPPQSIADHIDDALKHVAGLTPRQRLAVHNEMVKLCRDISFIRMIAEQIRGPFSEAKWPQ